MRMLDAWTEVEEEVWCLQKLEGYILCRIVGKNGRRSIRIENWWLELRVDSITVGVVSLLCIRWLDKRSLTSKFESTGDRILVSNTRTWIRIESIRPSGEIFGSAWELRSFDERESSMNDFLTWRPTHCWEFRPLDERESSVNDSLTWRLAYWCQSRFARANAVSLPTWIADNSHRYPPNGPPS
jgi:hypothetical protein